MQKNKATHTILFMVLFSSLLLGCATKYVLITKIDSDIKFPTYDLGVSEFEYIVNCNAIYIKKTTNDSMNQKYFYQLWAPKQDTILDKKRIKKIKNENMKISYIFPSKYNYILPAFYNPKEAKELLKNPTSIYWLRDWINSDNSRMSKETTIHLYGGKEEERDTTLVSYSRSKLLGINKRIIVYKKNSSFNDTIYVGHQYESDERWGPPKRVQMINRIIIVNGKYFLIKEK